MTEETYNFFHTYMKSHMARKNGEDSGRKTVVSSDGYLYFFIIILVIMNFVSYK
jgi:hypothetical protein